MRLRSKSELERIDGFISVERFASLVEEGKILSLSFWRDEQAVERWRTQIDHRAAQRAGRAGIFRDYRLRVASVLRDYGMFERDQAPPAEADAGSRVRRRPALRLSGEASRALHPAWRFPGLSPSRILRTIVTCSALERARRLGPAHSESSKPTRTFPPIAAA